MILSSSAISTRAVAKLKVVSIKTKKLSLLCFRVMEVEPFPQSRVQENFFAPLKIFFRSNGAAECWQSKTPSALKKRLCMLAKQKRHIHPLKKTRIQNSFSDQSIFNLDAVEQ